MTVPLGSVNSCSRRVPIYNTSFYANKPWFFQATTREAGANVLYGGAIFEELPRDELPAEATVRSLVAAITGEPFVVLDIEGYPMSRNDTDEDILSGVDKLVTVVGWAKDERPDLQVGVYMTAPMRDFWRAVRVNPTYEEWQRQNDLIQPLADAVDILCPSLYTFYPQAQGAGLQWSTYITENIAEARRLANGKPVYPFMWPQYHEGGSFQDYPFIEGSYLKDQLELVSSLADGILFWGSNIHVDAQYNNEADAWGDWWASMRDFMVCR